MDLERMARIAAEFVQECTENQYEMTASHMLQKVGVQTPDEGLFVAYLSKELLARDLLGSVREGASTFSKIGRA